MFEPSLKTSLTVLLGYLFPSFRLLPISLNRDLDNAKKILRDTALSMIHLKRGMVDKEARGDKDIVAVMIEANRNSVEKGMPQDVLTDSEMVDHIKTFLVAGFVFC